MTAEPRDGRTPSGGAPERLLQLTRPASAPKRPVSPTDQLGHQNAAGSWSPAGQRRPTAPTAPFHRRRSRLACRHPCQPAYRLVLVAPPRPWAASWHLPASPPVAALRASSSRWRASTTEVAVSTFGAPKVAKAMHPCTALRASLRFGEITVPPFAFLASVTKAQPSLATCIFAAARCGGEKLGERRKISSARDSCSAAVGASSDSSASASAAISARACARAQQLQICLY